MVAIIKYNAGNIKSVQNSLRRINVDSIVTNDPKTILAADKVIFPGVGEASSAMQYLKGRKLDDVILNVTQPFLGICLGLQLMCNHTEEGNVNCLGVFDSEVKLFPPDLKVPHMGWNNLSHIKSQLMKNVSTADDFYFVHDLCV